MTDATPGILGLATYLPPTRLTSAELAEKTGLPEWVVRDKLGVHQKVVPGPSDHPHEMAVKAGRLALERAHVRPEDIDLVISITEEYKDYPMMTTGIALAGDLGLSRAWAFDIAQRCGTAVVAMKIAKDMMRSDPRIRYALIAGGYQNSDLIDYANPRVRFMYNLAAGAGAVVLGRDRAPHRILGASFLTDGSFSRDVLSPRGGTHAPLGSWDRPYLDVPDPEGMKDRLEARSMNNFLHVVHDALQESGLTSADIGYLSLLHMKRSAHRAILQELHLADHQSIYLEDYGHIGQIDQILSTELALERGLINPGDYVVWVSAGIGYAWDALVIQWGAALT